MDVDRDSAALFASRVIARVVGFASVAYFTWKVGAAGFGIYITFQTVVMVAGVASQFGVPEAVTKRVSQAEDVHGRGRVLTAALALSVVPFAITSAVIYAIAPQLGAYVELGAITASLAVVAIALAIANRLFIAGLRGEGRIAATAVVELVAQLVRVGASVGFLLVGFDAIGLVYGYLVGVVASVLAGYVLLNTGIRLTVPSRDSVESLFGFSKFTIGMNVSELAYSWADTLILAALASKAIVGTYEVAWQLSLVTLMAAQVIGTTMMPAMTRWHENGNLGRIEQAFRTSLTFALVLVIPTLVGALVVGEEVFRVVYGIDEYAAAGATVLVLLLGGQIAQAVKQITQNTLLGIDRPEHVFWTNAVTLTSNVGLNLLLVPQYGMFGAAAATVSTATIAAITQVYYLRRYIDLTIDARSLAWQVGAAATMGGIVYALGSVVDGESIPGFVALVGTGIVVYGLGVVTNGTIRRSVTRIAPW
ncbi:oligosaccharide flippase family protein [Halobium salinum]|uniref:Oligosaccharide flippase family protein n=1 Tax=Halobium salinum TaxID=1364940 RepID=A0ABD5PC34_9EURY|nr:oligosaccharide flippase family protein [Halobium salinum]